MADDDPLSLGLMREVLEPLGFAVHSAGDGLACLELVEKYRPDLVILDINMPGMTGWETATAIRDAGHGEVAILMVSAEFQQPPNLKGREPVHDDYLVKPIEIPLLLERIQTLLDIEWTPGAQEVTP
jgi:DNA-binding response OmpR family regulator